MHITIPAIHVYQSLLVMYVITHINKEHYSSHLCGTILHTHTTHVVTHMPPCYGASRLVQVRYLSQVTYAIPMSSALSC